MRQHKFMRRGYTIAAAGAVLTVPAAVTGPRCVIPAPGRMLVLALASMPAGRILWLERNHAIGYFANVLGSAHRTRQWGTSTMTVDRRRILQIALGGGSLSPLVLPERWVKPVVKSVIVPAHAAASPATTTTTTTTPRPTSTVE
jgi:hypothetical protein